MADMTMGQRIAVRRKLKNMSQEALAEQLEVSRQAISKWESDGAIPEVDKLIALGKIFGVSVGWLLGTEQSPEGFPPLEEGLTESQVVAVEEIVARSLSAPQSKHRWWHGVVLKLAVLALALALGAAYAGRLEERNTENQVAMEFLRQENEALRDQVDSMQGKLNAMAEADRLLKSMNGEAVILDDQNIRVSFTFTPKVYQEGAQAFLSVRMPPENAEYIPCTWNGEKYTVEVELDCRDGYEYSFLLVTDGMFREQSLMDPDFYYGIARLSDIATNCLFHLDPDSEQFHLMQKDEHRWLDPELEEYVFQANLYSPRIFRENGRGYQEILLILEMNGEVLLKESLLEDFLRHSGGHPISTKPFPLDVAVPLPELKYGDKLRLYLSVTMEDGTPSYTLLDEMFSWERPE